VAQVVEGPLDKCEALSSNTSTAKKKKKKERKKKRKLGKKPYSCDIHIAMKKMSYCST
jgi:hypothetical protein